MTGGRKSPSRLPHGLMAMANLGDIVGEEWRSGVVEVGRKKQAKWSVKRKQASSL